MNSIIKWIKRLFEQNPREVHESVWPLSAVPKKTVATAMAVVCVASGFGAITPSNCSIEANGWVLDVDMSNSDAGGDFTSGFATNNSGVPNIVLTLTSNGYDDTGTTTTLSRTVYGTKILRKLYPNNAQRDIAISGSTATVKFSLSEYIFSDDSSITVSIAANTYSNNVVGSNLSVANNSTATHPKCLANWSYPGWQVIQSNTMVLRAVGFHRSGQNGRPLRVMRFVARDQHSHAITNFVTAMTIDSSLGDAVPICEYVTSMDISSFTQADPIRCDFAAYPWVGDAGAVLDTMDGVNTQPTPFYAPITNLCDRLGTFCTTKAVVDPSGSDVNGRASTNTDPTTISSGVYFASIGKAVNFAIATNNAFLNHNDACGVTVYLTAGSYTFAGASLAYSGTTGATNCWVTIKPYPGVARTSAIIGNNSGDRLLGNNKIHLQGITVTNASALEFLSVPYLWVDGCYLNHQTGTTFDGTEYEYFTDNFITNIVGGISYISGQTKVPILVRGNSVTNSQLSGGAAIGIFSYTAIGNLIDYRGVASFPTAVFATDSLSGAMPAGVPTSTNAIIAYNRVIGLNSALTVINCGQVSNNVNGAAIIQNVIEKTSSSGSQPIFQIAANGANDAVTNYSNVLVWYLTGEGERWNCAYDASGTSNHNRFFWSVKKSITGSTYNIKSDTYASFDTASGSRIGNWPVLYGVGFDGNGISAITNFSSAGLFLNAFSGLNSTMTNAEALASLTHGQKAGYWQYISSGGYDGVTAGSGSGNYQLRYSSPVIVNQLGNWYGLPFDIAGKPRGQTDPPGAYAFHPPTILVKGATTYLQKGATTVLQP